MLRDAPRVLLMAATMTCGVLLALAVHIITSRLGVGLASPWRGPFPAHAEQLRAVLAWWLIAAAAGFGSWGAAVLLTQPPWRWPRLRAALQWGVGLTFLLVLAGAERYGPGEAGVGISAKILTSLVALGLGAVMAYCGSYFALRR
jgi:hypothetical protein